MSRDALQAAVKRVRLVGQSKDTAPVRLAMSAEGLELSAIAQDVGEAHEIGRGEVRGHRPHGGVQPAVPARRHRRGCVGDEVVLETLDPLKPATLKGTDSADFLYLLMPVRIS